MNIKRLKENLGAMGSYFDLEKAITDGNIGKHETFTPRYGWLKKGFDAVKKDQAIFRAPDAIEVLGVGKNMVRSIKSWCTAFNLIEPVSGKKGFMKTTKFAEKLLGDGGWDPYLEDVATIWLLHWQLFIPPFEAASWHFAFNKSITRSFDIKQLGGMLNDSAQKYPRYASISIKTFEKDASCLIRMYTEDHNSESEISCPFTDLGLMNINDDKEIDFNIAERETLPSLIFAAAVFSYLQYYAPEKQRTISVNRLSYADSSPGVAFKLPETFVNSHLFKATKEIDEIELRDDMGGFQLYLNDNPKNLFEIALSRYYGGKSG